MGYRDDLIARIKDLGAWDGFPAEMQRKYEGVTDQQAKQVLLICDRASANRQLGALATLPLVDGFRSLFDGRLIDSETWELTAAGNLLAQFFDAMIGLDNDTMEESLEALKSPLRRIALAMMRDANAG